jgi:hypothetical protein
MLVLLDISPFDSEIYTAGYARGVVLPTSKRCVSQQICGFHECAVVVVALEQLLNALQAFKLLAEVRALCFLE